MCLLSNYLLSGSEGALQEPGMLWHEGKVETKDQSRSKETQATGQPGGWAGGWSQSLSQAIVYPSFWQSFLRKWKIVFHWQSMELWFSCSVGNACSPTVLGCWCLFLPYKSLVSWDAWLGCVESSGSRAPLCVCSKTRLQGCQLRVCFFLPLPAEYSEE